MKRQIFSLFLLLLTLVACGDKPLDPNKPVYVKIKTTMGDVTVLLYDDTPLHRDNFIKLCQSNEYEGMLFHRVIKDFMIQSGDPKGDGTGGESIWKKGFAVEPTPFLYNIRGALAMANTGAKESNGSQFYIVQNKDDQSKQLGNAGYPKPIIDAYQKRWLPSWRY